MSKHRYIRGGCGCARQVDLIVCFDTSKSPIRNIQRMGRTGRHRPGRVVYILASGKEADDYQSNLVVPHELNHWTSTPVYAHAVPIC